MKVSFTVSEKHESYPVFGRLEKMYNEALHNYEYITGEIKSRRTRTCTIGTTTQIISTAKECVGDLTEKLIYES
jgi:hypothetical protein